jgi:hypothetical protein
MTRFRIAGLSAAAISVALLAGCRVESKKNGDGKDVNIVTPFGGMHVNTNDTDVMSSIGLQAYPGAQVVTKDDDKDSSADVNMSFGGFTLRVKAAKLRSNDAPDKVEAFYRNGLKQYGDVIACRNHVAIGTPVRTAEGLTCSSNQDGHVTVDGSHPTHALELKAGSQQHQHIVTIDPDSGGTRIDLVALELPGKIHFDGNDDTRQ